MSGATSNSDVEVLIKLVYWLSAKLFANTL